MNHTHCVCEFIESTDVNALVWRSYCCERVKAQQKVKIHSHQPLELVFVRSGQGSAQFGSTIEHIAAGQCLMIAPNVVHRIYCDETEPFTIASLHFNGDRKLSDCLLECDANQVEQRFLGGRGYIKICNTSIGGIALRLIAELENREKQRDLMIKLLFAELFLAISRFLVNNTAHASDANAAQYIAGAKTHIEENLAQPLTPASISKSLYISAGYLMHLFKDHFGMTLMEYVYFRRVEKSRMLLSETTDKITSIAPMVGIPNTQYFSVLFKKQTGKTPREYRRSYNVVFYSD